MKNILAILGLIFLSGCARIHDGVMETITYHDQKWTVCSGSVWHPFNGSSDSNRLIIMLTTGKTVELNGDYKIESSTEVCHF